MTAYYNEFDRYAADWLRELIKEGLIAPGDVDDRSITDVVAADLDGYTQCHFFAGIGGWSYALRLAGWSDDRPVWTGSPPCQPFSNAGKQKGKEDDRHLWPHFYDLIRESRPPVLFGEQVASSIKHHWFDDLQDDMAREDYATAMAVLPACSVGAPHKRDRLFFLAHSINPGLQGHGEPGEHPVSFMREGEDGHGAPGSIHGAITGGAGSTVGDTEHDGSHETAVTGSPAETGKGDQEGAQVPMQPAGAGGSDQSGDICHWGDSGFIKCRDDKFRLVPTEPAFFPLVDGLSPNRVGLLRGAGNAIVPQVAEQFIRAYMHDH